MKRIQYALDNGLTVVLQPMATAPVVACNIWVGVGSADELPQEAGLAHVHEHMLFKGTESRGVGQIAHDVEAAGGHINAFTSFDQTCYYVVLSSRFFDAGLDILSDAIGHSSFDADELARELEVIQEEIKRGEDNPSRVSSKMLFETAFQTHPYRLPIIGTSESVDSFAREDVLNFYQKHYVPANMAVVIAGDFEVDQAKERVAHYFGDLPAADYTPLARPAEPAQSAPRAQVTQQDIRQNHLRMAFHIPDVRHEDIPALDLLGVILGYGDASHLYRTIQREAELVHNIYASAYTPREAGLFVVGAEFQRDPERPQTAPPAVLARILEEVYRLRHLAPSKSDLERARTLVESQAIYGKQTIEGLAMKMGHYLMVAGDVAFEEEYYRALRQVRPADIRRVAQTYLTVSNTTAVLLHPDDAPPVAPADLIDACQRAFEKASADAVDVSTGTDDEGFARFEIPQGPTLIVQRDPTVETFSLRALTLGGSRFESPTDAGIHKLLAQLITGGTSTHSALEIAGRVESMAASIGGIAGRNSFGIGMTGLTRFFDECFDIFADCILDASIPDREFARERRIQREQLTARRDQLGAVNYDQFAAAFFGPHPYSLPLLGTEATLQALTPAAMRYYLQRRQDPSKMVITAVGDITVDEVAQHVERYFGAAERQEFPAPQIPGFEPPGEPSLIVSDLEKEQAHIIVGYPAPLLTSDDLFALDVLYAVLSGQGGRLFFELRDRQSLAYSVFATRTVGLDASTFSIRIATSPEKIARAVDGIREQVQLLRDQGITQQELDRAKRFLIGNHDIGLQRNSSRAMTFGLDELYGMGYRRSLAYGDHIADVTIGDVQTIVDTWFDPQQVVVSIVKPSTTTVDPQTLGLVAL